MIHTINAVGVIVLAAVSAHLGLKLRQRGRLLKWTDDRDAEFARLFQAAWKLTFLPKDNPLTNFKAHGMLSKNAFMNSDVLLPALDERLGVLEIVMKAVSREAKALKTWESLHPAPPANYWQAWGSRTKTTDATSEVKPSILDGKMLGDGS